MGRFPAAVPHVSRRQVHSAAKHALAESDRAREVLMNGVLPALQAYEARVVALETALSGFLNQSLWGRLKWLVLGR
jgi:hypothetical protein